MANKRTMNALLGQPGNVLLPASAGAARRQVPFDELLSAAAAEGAAVWHLHCDFAEGGPWAGVRDLFRSLLDDIRRQRPDLIEMHDYELLYVLPELRRQMKLRNPCLTDIATAEERIRNYPADRAFRITHGLIDLLAEYKQTAAAGRTWLWVCADYDSAGAMASHFLQELMRRRGEELRLVLLPVFSGRGPDAGSLGFSCAVRELPFGVAVPVREALDPREAARQAAVLDLEIDANALGRTAKLPDVIYLWSLAGRKDKVLRRCTHAVESYNVLGLYRDAQRYGERAQSFPLHPAPPGADAGAGGLPPPGAASRRRWRGAPPGLQRRPGARTPPDDTFADLSLQQNAPAYRPEIRFGSDRKLGPQGLRRLGAGRPR